MVVGMVVVIGAIAAWRVPVGFKGLLGRSGASTHVPTLVATGSAPPAFQVVSAPKSTPLRPPTQTNGQNEFAADDAVVLSASDEHASQDAASDSGRDFARSYRSVALRFSGETSTEVGSTAAFGGGESNFRA